MCPHCQSLEWETLRSTGRGTIYSYVITHHPPIPPFEYPFATVLIELEEGIKFVSSLLDIELEQVAIGMPVEVVFHEVEEGFTLPLFRPAS